MPNTKDTGTIAEARIVAALMGHGYKISLPWGENNGYDLIADDGKQLYRVQCRTGHQQGGSIVFSVARIFYSSKDKKVIRHPRSSSIDLYAIHYAGNIYLIPASDIISNHSVSLGAIKQTKYLL